MNKIEDDMEKFSADPNIRTSGIFVGDFSSLEDITKENASWTVIRNTSITQIFCLLFLPQHKSQY